MPTAREQQAANSATGAPVSVVTRVPGHAVAGSAAGGAASNPTLAGRSSAQPTAVPAEPLDFMAALQQRARGAEPVERPVGTEARP